ncbi:Negative elongation factor C/D [Mortierella sp. GBA30]|nr:Negative elongation factor C/D [Mortierella sp. GBA30]
MSSKNTSAAAGGDGAISSIEAKLQSFQAPDSILEPAVVQMITDFLQSGGQPLQVVNTLSNSYVGMPEMCNLMSEWSQEFDIDPIEVMQEVLKEKLMDRFDTVSVDETFTTGQLPWLTEMIQQPFWRSVIYELSEKYQKSLLLNFAIQRISDAGYQGEIASVATASTFVNVFSGVLLDSLDKLREEDDVGLLDRLPDLITAVGVNTKDVVSRSIIDSSKCDLSYSSIACPLAWRCLIEIMLSSIFVPNFKGGMVKQDHKEKYLWLMAYAASAQENDDGTTDTSDVPATYEALIALEDTLSKRTAGTDLVPILKNLLVAIETPVASMALLYWIQFVIKETSYIETYFRSHEVPVPLLLIEEMAYKHPLQQSEVFATLVDFFEGPLELNPEIMMIYRKSILDRMIYLMQLNYVMPVLDYVRVRARRMDQSLALHFVKRVLEMIEGPYSNKFVEGMGQMIQAIIEVIKKSDAEPVVRTWIDEVVSQPVDVEAHNTPPASASSEAHSTLTDAGLGTIQELKRRLEEPRR